MTDLKAMEALTHPERFAIDKQMEAVKTAVFALKERIERGNAPDINVGSKWISVEDELPENDADVLASYKFKTSGSMTVTHWMPLPELPKEDKP